MSDCPALLLVDLPPEVLHLICQHLSPRNITNLRLVCRLLATVGIEHLAEEAYVCFKRASFADLTALADTALSSRITSLFISGEQLDFLHTYQEWLELAMGVRRYRYILRLLSDSEKHERYTDDMRDFAKQSKLIQEGVHRQSLSSFFEKCPNLKSLAISFARGIWNVEVMERYSVAFKRNLRSLDFPTWAHLDAGNTSNILELATQAGVGLENLAIGYLPLESFTSTNPHISSSQAALCSLSTLVLKIKPIPSTSLQLQPNGNYEITRDNTNEVELKADKIEQQLSSFISAAPNLLHLRFDVGHDQRRVLGKCLLRGIFDRNVHPKIFPGLRSLSLECVRVDGCALEKFLLARKQTLKFIRLIDIGLENPRDEYTWQKFFGSIPTRLPEIRHFMVYGSLSDKSDTPWIFGGTFDGRSSWKTHAMDIYLREGGPLPHDEDSVSVHIPDPTIYHRVEKDGSFPAHLCYIENPSTFGQGLLAESKDRFWMDHFWRFKVDHKF